jgi:hypothetical protein
LDIAPPGRPEQVVLTLARGIKKGLDIFGFVVEVTNFDVFVGWIVAFVEELNLFLLPSIIEAIVRVFRQHRQRRTHLEIEE